MLKSLNLILLLLSLLLVTNSYSQEFCVSQGTADSLVVSIKKAELYKQLSIEQDIKIKNLEVYSAVSDSIISNKDSIIKIENSKFNACEDVRKLELQKYKSDKLKYMLIAGVSGLTIGLLLNVIF